MEYSLQKNYSNTHSFSIDLGLSGITVEKFGEIEKKWDSNFSIIYLELILILIRTWRRLLLTLWKFIWI